MHRAGRLIFILAATILVLRLPAQASVEIKLRLKTESLAFSLSGMNLKIERQSLPGAAFYQAVRLQAQTLANETTWTVRDRDSGHLLKVCKKKLLEISGEHVRLGLQPMPQNLLLHALGGSRVEVIAKLDLEAYLARVLPSEMPLNWPLEALKAQAVAARTFAVYRRNQREKTGAYYHLEASVMDQAFNWTEDDEVLKDDHKNLLRALQETAGLVLLDQYDAAFAAYFHADCGGQTEQAQNVWGTGPSLGTVVDKGCPMSPMAHWTLQMSREDLSQRLAHFMKLPPTWQVEKLDPAETSDSGRSTFLNITFSNQMHKKLSGQDLRAAIGFERLRSTRFELQRYGNDFRFIGQGFGHGVGLCQWGARTLAREKMSFTQILKHYYPKANLGMISEPYDETSGPTHL